MSPSDCTWPKWVDVRQRVGWGVPGAISWEGVEKEPYADLGTQSLSGLHEKRRGRVGRLSRRTPIWRRWYVNSWYKKINGTSSQMENRKYNRLVLHPTSDQLVKDWKGQKVWILKYSAKTVLSSQKLCATEALGDYVALCKIELSSTMSPLSFEPQVY